MKVLLSLVLLSLLTFSQAETKHQIDIIKYKFTPAEITINVGDTIRWTNKEKRQYHSVWFEQLGEPEPDYFFPDEFFERSFKDIGDFPYRCGPHPKMTGMVHVINEIKEKIIKPAPEKQSIKKSKMTLVVTNKRKKDILHLLKHDCGSCHGMTLKGGLGPSLKPEALKKFTDKQLALVITHGRPGTPMPPWKPFFTEQETRWLAQRLKTGVID